MVVWVRCGRGAPDGADVNTDPDPIFVAEGLYKSFDSLVVAENVSLTLKRGSRHGLIGPNGAGKTTLFNLFTGEVKADRGRVLLNGKNISHLSPDARARRGLARSFQRNNLFSDLTVRENLEVACILRQRKGAVFWSVLARDSTLRDEVNTFAERLRLAGDLDTPVRCLSYGTQRQLEIGLVLSMEPILLLLDEPTAGMSQEETNAIRTLIETLPKTLTVLIIEHDMDVLFGIAERITVLDYGRVLLEADPDTVRSSTLVQARYLGIARG